MKHPRGRDKVSISRNVLGVGLLTALLLQAGCSAFGSGERRPVATPSSDELLDDLEEQQSGRRPSEESTIWDLFQQREDQGQIGAVNKYIWNAALETLDFLPIETVDPFTGVIVTGYGTPPGGGRAYRATVHISDPALDARSLNLSMSTRSGPVSASTVHAVEDAILTRARQLRARDGKI